MKDTGREQKALLRSMLSRAAIADPKSFQNFGVNQTEVPENVLFLDLFMLVMKSVIHPVLVVSIALSASVTYLTNEVIDNPEIISWLEHMKPATVVMASLLSFALVFRTNICYSRWWEGRTLWGKLIYATIHASQQSQCFIQNDKKRIRFTDFATIFAWASKAQLRGKSIKDDSEEGGELVRRGLLSEKELNEIAAQPGWQAYYCMDVMRAVMHEAMEETDDLRGAQKTAQLIAVEDTLRDMATSIGGMIRVKATGLPVNYNAFFQVIAALFMVLTCFAWSSKMGWFTPIVIGFLTFVYIALATIGNHMEDPFGTDLSDLPMKKFCSVVEAQIWAINKRKKIGFDLASGPSEESSRWGPNMGDGSV